MSFEELKRALAAEAQAKGICSEWYSFILRATSKERLLTLFVKGLDFVFDNYNPQIQISAESGTKRSIFRQKNKTKRSKNRLHTTLIKPEQKVNEDLCSGFVLS